MYGNLLGMIGETTVPHERTIVSRSTTRAPDGSCRRMSRLALRSGKIPSMAWIVAQVQRFDDRRVRSGLGLDLGHCGGDVDAAGEWIKCGLSAFTGSERRTKIMRNNNGGGVVAWFLAGVVGGMTIAYTAKSLVDRHRRETSAWERAWEASSFPLVIKTKEVVIEEES